MSIRRCLRWACSSFLAVSLLSGVAFGAEIPNIDDIVDVDKAWEEFNGIPSILPTSTPAPSPAPEEGEGEDLYSLDLDTGIMPLALPDLEGNSKNSYINWSGITVYRAGEVTITRPINFLDGTTTITMYEYTGTGSGSRYINLASGTYVDIYVQRSSSNTTPIYTYGNFPYVTARGQLSGGLYLSAGGTSVTKYPSSVRLLVNGNVYGTLYTLSASTGVAATVNENIDLSKTGDIYSVGYRYYFNAYTMPSGTSKSGPLMQFRLGDTMVWTGTEGGGNQEVVDGLGDLQKEQEKTNGFLQQIITNITNVAQQIAHLPGLIADEIMGRIRSLFVPTEEDLTQLKADYQTMLETKFGFIYQAFQMLENLWTTLVDGWSSHSDYSFNFPGISFDMQGTTYTLVSPQVVSLDNELMTILRGVLGTFVSFICVLGGVHSLETMFIAIISGKNYFDYINAAYDMMADDGLLEEDEIV